MKLLMESTVTHVLSIGGLLNQNSFFTISIPEPHTNYFSPGCRNILADVISPNRQLSVTSINKYRQLNLARATIIDLLSFPTRRSSDLTIIDQSIQGSPGGASGK